MNNSTTLETPAMPATPLTSPAPTSRAARFLFGSFGRFAVGCLFAGLPALGAESLPERLSQTGLYADLATKQVAPDLLAFTPQYPLWSDGARKSRWISLPAGTSIDAAGSRRLGVSGRHPAVEGVRLRAPRRNALHRAHRRRLGLRHLSLARRRERRCPGAEVRRARGLRDRGRVLLRFAGANGLSRLPRGQRVAGARLLGAAAVGGARPGRAARRGCARATSISPSSSVRAGCKGLPAALVAFRRRSRRGRPRSAPPSATSTATARTATTRAARSPTSTSRSRSGSAPERRGRPAALATALERMARFQPSGAAPMARFAPGRPEASLVLQRMSRRDPISQMPPLGAKVVDREAVALVERWIRDGLLQPHRHTNRFTGGETMKIAAKGIAIAMALVAVTVVRAQAQTTAALPAGDKAADRVALGAKFVQLGGCDDCHTTKKMGPNGPEPDMSRRLSGHPQEMIMPPAQQLPPGPWVATVAGTLTAWSGPWGVSFTAESDPRSRRPVSASGPRRSFWRRSRPAAIRAAAGRSCRRCRGSSIRRCPKRI